MKNRLNRRYVIVNDINDFKIPYKIYGKIDREIMLDKYNRLTNNPKSYLQVRFYNGTATF
jgi:hypothetical protein